MIKTSKIFILNFIIALSLIGCSNKTIKIPFESRLRVSFYSENRAIYLGFDLFYELGANEKKTLIKSFSVDKKDVILYVTGRNAYYFHQFVKDESSNIYKLKSEFKRRIKYNPFEKKGDTKNNIDAITIKMELEEILQNYLKTKYYFYNIRLGNISVVYDNNIFDNKETGE